MLVFRRVHVVAQLVGGEPEFGLEANGGRGGIGITFGFRAGHVQFPNGMVIALWSVYLVPLP